MVSNAVMLSESTLGMKLNLRKPPATTRHAEEEKDERHRHRQIAPLKGEIEGSCGTGPAINHWSHGCTRAWIRSIGPRKRTHNLG